MHGRQGFMQDQHFAIQISSTISSWTRATVFRMTASTRMTFWSMHKDRPAPISITPFPR